MSTREPALVHSWLGPLYPHDDQELLGSIDVDAEIRVPRNNGDHDLEVLMVVPGRHPSPGLMDHLDQAVDRIKSSLAALSELRAYALQYAPQDWITYYSAQPGPPLLERLFLDGIEVKRDLSLELAFDFGGLDQLVLTIDVSGKPSVVMLRPSSPFRLTHP